MPFSLEDTLNSFVERGSQAGDSESPRNPFVFTSTLRQLSKKQTTQAKQTFDSALGGTSLSQVWVGPNLMEFIVLSINPKSIKFHQPKRYGKVDVMSGSVIHHFTNSKGENNDLLTLTFRGSTGNIDRRSIIDPFAHGDENAISDETGAFQKLLVWHNLWALTRERVLLEDGTPNEITISYASSLIPTVIDFTGIFTSVMDFEEGADKPNSSEYSMEFLVQKTNPDLEVLIDEVQTVLSAVQAVPSTAAQVLATTKEGNVGTITDGRSL